MDLQGRKAAGGRTADTIVKIEIVKMFLIRTSRILTFILKGFKIFFLQSFDTVNASKALEISCSIPVLKNRDYNPSLPCISF